MNLRRETKYHYGRYDSTNNPRYAPFLEFLHILLRGKGWNSSPTQTLLSWQVAQKHPYSGNWRLHGPRSPSCHLVIRLVSFYLAV